MNDIRTLLQKAGRRLEAAAFLHNAHLVAVVTAIIAVVLMIADRLPAESFIPWMWVGPLLIVSGLIVAIALWMRQRRSELDVAIEVDERLQLRERLSTALHCRDRDDSFAQAAFEDAVKTARDPRHREAVKRQFAITPPAGWWMSPLLVLIALMLSMISPLDVFSREDPQTQQFVEATNQAEQTIQAVVQEIRKSDALSKELGDDFSDLSDDGIDPDRPRTPEDVRRKAIKKVTDLNRRLEELINGEKGKTVEAMENRLSDLQPPESGPGKELAEALNKGEFTAAKNAMEKLLEQMEQGELTEQQQEELAEQLQTIADQLEELAKQQDELEEALKQAGMDPDLANDQQALQEAIEKNPNLNQEQKQQLQQMAEAQQQARQMCEGLGGACQGMAQAISKGAEGQQGQIAQGGQQVMDQLSEMEQLDQLLKEAKAAAGACKGSSGALGEGLANGEGMSQQAAMQQWLSQSQGQGGMGKRGSGQGGKAPIAPTPFKVDPTKADVNTTPDGDIIARTLIDGPQAIGESRQDIVQVMLETIDGYDEAVEEERVPPKYIDAQKHFHGELEARIKAITAKEGNNSPQAAESTAESTDQEKDDD